VELPTGRQVLVVENVASAESVAQLGLQLGDTRLLLRVGLTEQQCVDRIFACGGGLRAKLDGEGFGVARALLQGGEARLLFGGE